MKAASLPQHELSRPFRSVLVAVKQRALSVDQALGEILALVEARENLTFQTVRLAITEMEREVEYLKTRRP